MKKCNLFKIINNSEWNAVLLPKDKDLQEIESYFCESKSGVIFDFNPTQKEIDLDDYFFIIFCLKEDNCSIEEAVDLGIFLEYHFL